MSTTGLRTRRRLAVVLASVIALGGLVGLAPSASAQQTGTPVAASGVATWGISEYLNSGNQGRPAPSPANYTAPATFDAATKLSAFKGGNVTGSVAADGTATLSYTGATVNWAAGTGNGWIRFADPIVTVDATGTGTVSAEVSYGTTADGVTWSAASAQRGPSRIVIENLSPDAEVGDAAYPTSLSSLTYAFSAATGKYTWSNLIGRWSDALIAFVGGDAGVDPAIPAWAFKTTVVNNVVNNVVRYPAALNLTLDRTTAATSTTAALDSDGILLTVTGTGFKKTSPGIYASLRERTTGDAAYAGESLPMEAPTAWVSNNAGDINPDPATGASGSIADDGSFSAPIRITKEQIATLDATKDYTVVTRKAHGQGAGAAHADQISETPINLAALITEAKARKDTTTSATAATVTFPAAATANVTVAATGATPTGAVTIKDGATTVGTSDLVGGTASIPVAGQAVGTKQYDVLYEGGNGFWKSAGTVSVTVTAAKTPSAITVTGPATAAYRTATTYVANVSAGTGNVVLTGAGTAISKPIVNGKATFALPATLGAGARTIAFAYAGDTTTAAATKVFKQITIAKGASTVSAAITTKPTSTKAGKVTVAVYSTKGGPVPTGTFTVKLAKGSTSKTLTAKTLSDGRLSFALPAIGKGTWYLKITYNGSTQHLGSTKTYTVKVTS